MADFNDELSAKLSRNWVLPAQVTNIEEEDEAVTTREYCDTVSLPPADQVARVSKIFNADGTETTKLRARKSAFIAKLLYLDGKPFDFTGRDYLKSIYDSRDKKILLKTARQVEKCLTKNCLYTLSNGRTVLVRDMKVGDYLCSLNESTGKISKGKVVAIEENGVKPLLKITTKKKRSTVVTHNHPFYKLLGWEDAASLKVGDFIALPQQAGDFGNIACPEFAFVLGALLGDGCLCVSFNSSWYGFTKRPGEMSSAFRKSVELFCGKKVPPSFTDIRSGSERIYLGEERNLTDKLTEIGINGVSSEFKFIPDECFEYNEESTIMLLRGLWGTDGHCKNVTKSKIDLCYSSISKELIHGVQALLLKFGVFSVIRENIPKSYIGTVKIGYILRVIGRKSFENFYNKIGPIPGKPFTLSDCIENNNSNKIPKDVDVLLRKKRAEWKLKLKTEGKKFQGENSWQKAGIRLDNQYDGYSYPKFKKFCEFFNDPELWNIYNSDIFWDEVISIEELPPEMTYGVEVEGYHNHITDGIITHNTTMLGNNMVIKSLVYPYHKSLYVSPSHTQTRQFSNEKLRPLLERSPFVSKYFQDSRCSTQVFEKGFTNGSFIFMRSCFRTADRARGISAPDLYLDEIQDLLISEIPVIAECTSHFDDYFHLFAGTPKTFDNPIEYFWQDSTQNEWMVKCHACNHWNFLDERNIAATHLYHNKSLPPGPVCKKCQKPINPAKGVWTCFHEKGSRRGYRIPQLMVPWIVSTYDQWDKILWKRDNYPMGQLYNEVFGLSYDSANKPITKEELVQCCDPSHSLLPYPFLMEHVHKYFHLPLAAGIDWGEGNDGSGKTPSGKIRVASYTVLTIGYYENPDLFVPVFIKKYIGREIDPNYIINDVAGICKTLNVSLIGCDWGHGWGMNNQLKRILGPDRVMEFQHLPKLKQNMKWDHISRRFQLKRNFWISELFVAIKNKKIKFPRWFEFEPFSRDILAVYAEYNEYTREIRYDHRSSDPDDFMHSLIYCKLAADTLIGRKQW